MDFYDLNSLEYLPQSIVIFIMFCLGTIIGSFLNVVILRAFSGESIVLPPSKCPKCGNYMIKRCGKYGFFMGCSGYPACKHTEKITNNK